MSLGFRILLHSSARSLRKQHLSGLHCVDAVCLDRWPGGQQGDRVLRVRAASASGFFRVWLKLVWPALQGEPRFLNEENGVGQTRPGEGHHVSGRWVIGKSPERERLRRPSVNAPNPTQLSWVHSPGGMGKLLCSCIALCLKKEIIGENGDGLHKVYKRGFRQTHLGDGTPVLPQELEYLLPVAGTRPGSSLVCHVRKPCRCLSAPPQPVKLCLMMPAGTLQITVLLCQPVGGAGRWEDPERHRLIPSACCFCVN